MPGTSPNVICGLRDFRSNITVRRWPNITSSTTARYNCNVSFVASGHTGGVLSSFYHYHPGWTGIKRHTGFINVEYLTRFVKELIVSEGLLQEIVVVIKDFKITSHSSSIGQGFCCSERQASMSSSKGCPPSICHQCSLHPLCSHYLLN